MNPSRIRSQVLLSCAAAFLVTTPVNAQRTAQVPEYVGQANAVTGSTATQLERQKPRNDMKIRALGFGGARIRQIVNGDRSPIRFRKGQDVAFIVRVASQEHDPLSTLQIIPLRVRKGQRELDLVSTGYAGITGARDRKNEKAIALSAERFGRNAFRVSALQPLEKGEYALITADSETLNLFAID